MNTLRNSFYLFIILALSMVTSAMAAEIRLDTNNAQIGVGDEVAVDVMVNELESINAIEGSVVFPKDLLEVIEIRDGNSVINFWITAPEVNDQGTITFSGITPGGFSGVSSRLFSIVFLAKQEGLAKIALQDFNALANDGQGTQIPITVRDVNITIKPGDSSVHKEDIKDTEPPEYFYAYIGQDESLFEGQYFLTFSTQDKNSGISHYEVREGVWRFFALAESPYLLKYQSLDRDIFIKAIDNKGNEQLSILKATNGSMWYDNSVIRNLILLLVIALGLFWALWKPLRKIRFIK